MKDLPVRKPNRLRDFDYGQNGAYFITVCVKDRHELLGRIDVGEHIVLPELSEIGKTVDNAIHNIEKIYDSVKVDKYVIMPNHIHMILMIVSDDGSTMCSPTISRVIKTEDGSTMCSPTISRIIKQCKEYVTKKVGYSIWQRSFHDHIIRDEKDYLNHWRYIDENPLKWQEDEYYG